MSFNIDVVHNPQTLSSGLSCTTDQRILPQVLGANNFPIFFHLFLDKLAVSTQIILK